MVGPEKVLNSNAPWPWFDIYLVQSCSAPGDFVSHVTSLEYFSHAVPSDNITVWLPMLRTFPKATDAIGSNES